MKKKKLVLLLIKLFVIGTLITPFVLAQEEVTEQDIKVLPDQPIKYFFLVKVPEKFKIATSFTKEKIIANKLKFAEKRALEYKLLAEKNSVKYLEKIEQKRKMLMEDVEKELVYVKSDDFKKIVEANLQKHIEVLKDVQNKVPESARQGISNAITASSKILNKLRGGEEPQIQEIELGIPV